MRYYGGDSFEAYSAGIEPTSEVHPYAVKVMEEVGIDISDQYPKRLRTYLGETGFNYLIIVCARAEKNCPKTFPGVHARISWLFDDPRGEDVPEEQMLERFREVRDEIERKILTWIEDPRVELAKLREERERQRRERMNAERREAGQEAENEALYSSLNAGERGSTSASRLQTC